MLFVCFVLLFVTQIHARIACGSVHTCFRTRFNATRCWGLERATSLLLGHGVLSLAGSGFPGSLTVRAAGDVSLPDDVASVHTAEAASCALLRTGVVFCWGDAASPVLADTLGNVVSDGGDDGDYGRVPMPVRALRTVGSARVVQLALGRTHACALLDSGQISCWGDNSDGQLGFGASPLPANRSFVPLPTQIVVAGVAQIAAGQAHTCVLTRTGDVFCWGSNTNYQLGTLPPVATPIAALNASLVPLPVDAYAAIASGARHTCAISRRTRALHCWGNGNAGRLGHGNSSAVAGSADTSSTAGLATLPPVALGANAKVAAVACGSTHTCVILDGVGGVRCFGANATGRLGYPTSGDVGALPSTTPDKYANVDLPLPATHVSAGDEHTCAVLTNGRVYCWGSGNTGQLGYNNASINVGSTLELLPKIVGPVDVGDDELTTTTTTTTLAATTTTTTLAPTSAMPTTKTEPASMSLAQVPADAFPWWGILILVVGLVLCCAFLLLLLLLLRRRKQKEEEEEAQEKRTPKKDAGELKEGAVVFTAGTTTNLAAIADEAGESASSASDSSELEAKKPKPKTKKRHSSKK